MKAAVYYGPHDIRFEEVDKPPVDEDGIRIRVKYCAICGTDVRIYNFGQANVIPPIITGHEVTGEVESVGKDCADFKVGDKVALVPQVACGKCEFCREGVTNLCMHPRAYGYSLNGGFAEYISVPGEILEKGNVIKLEPDADLLKAAITEPLSCVVNGHKFIDVQLGDTVAIIGSGPIGAMHVAISKARGASCVILADIDGDRLQLAKRVGADYLVNSKETDLESFIMEKTNGRGVDIAITAASVPEAQNQALGIVRKGGKVSFFAGLPKEKALHPVDANIIHYREVSVFGAYGSSVQQNILAYKLIQSGVVDAGTIISDVIPFENLVDGLERVKRGDGLKIVVEI